MARRENNTMRVSVPIVSAFVQDKFEKGERGGNAAGVVLDGEQYTAAQKQQIAALINLSETAFLSASAIADYRVEFFTPTAPINDCGHATVAAFSFLAQQGLLTGGTSSKELADGNVREIILKGDRTFMEQTTPQYTPLYEHPAGVTAGQVYKSLGLTEDDALLGFAPTVVSTGMPGLIVPLRDEAAVRRITPDLSAVKAITERLGTIAMYAFSREAQGAEHDAGARMFGPAVGIAEESATGMAAGTLACFLHDYLNVGKTALVIEQGFLMTPPSPSLLYAELAVTDGRVSSLLVGGYASHTHTQDIEID